MAQDQRKHIRVKPEPANPLKVHVNGEGFIDILPAIDVSMGGVGVLASHRFEHCDVNKSVQVSLHLPPPLKKGINAEGRLKHVRGNHFGIQFVNMAPAEKKLLKKYIGLRLEEFSMVTRMKFTLGLQS